MNQRLVLFVSLQTKLVLLLLVILVYQLPKVESVLLIGRGGMIRSVQCLFRFNAIDFNIGNFEKYNTTYFRNDSEARLAETGVFKGADGIEEYVRFSVSKYFKRSDVLQTKNEYLRYDRSSKLCIFRGLVESQSVVNTKYSNSNITYSGVLLLKLYFDLHQRYIKTMNLYYTPALLGYTFDVLLAGNKTIDFICNVTAGPCSTLIPQHPTDCMSILNTLPTTEGSGKYLDGNTSGCRALHAIFAEKNPIHHCPHISIEPTPDPNGIFKCQTSSYKNVTDYFTPNDFTSFQKFATDLGYDPEIGYRIVSG